PDWHDIGSARGLSACPRRRLAGDGQRAQRRNRGQLAGRFGNRLGCRSNQIGTISEALEAYQLARGAGWRVTVSARSGETEDNWLADLATGWGADQIKVGSITQAERLAKY